MQISFPRKLSAIQLSPNLTPIKKTRSTCCSEICAVCGDQSTGYHYEVPSCNGCKTFFRRTIISERVFTCNKNGNCLFNKDIRCACRSCRFNKCLEVGMNPKAIQTTRLGFESKESSAFRRQLSSDHMCDHWCVYLTFRDIFHFDLGLCHKAVKHLCIRKRTYDICSILDMEPSCSSLSSKCVSRSISPNDTTLPTNKKKMRESEMHEYIKHAHDLENRLFLLRKSDFLSSTSLLDVLTRPCALNNAHKYERLPLHFVSNNVDFEKESILAMEYAKSYTWFGEMPFTDKFTLLCDRILLLITLRLAYNKVVRNVEYQGTWSRHLKSIKEGIERVKVDQTTFALLNAIVLCDCACFSLSTQSKEILKVERDKFLDVLGAHLFEKYSSNGPSKMVDHISLMWSLHKDSRILGEYLLRHLPSPSLARQLIENK